jgi:hypothetical protein
VLLAYKHKSGPQEREIMWFTSTFSLGFSILETLQLLAQYACAYLTLSIFSYAGWNAYKLQENWHAPRLTGLLRNIVPSATLKRMSDYLSVPKPRWPKLRWTASTVNTGKLAQADISNNNYTIIVYAIAGVFLLSNLASVSSGYFYRDHELLSNMKTDDNAIVLDQVGPRTFALLDENGTQWKMHICPTSELPPFKPGMRVKVTYERMGDCMRVSGGKLGYWIAPEQR